MCQTRPRSGSTSPSMRRVRATRAGRALRGRSRHSLCRDAREAPRPDHRSRRAASRLPRRWSGDALLRCVASPDGRWASAWGAVARVFMRLITTSPEFSWAGTRHDLCLRRPLGPHRARGRRRAGRDPMVALAPLPGLILFAGAGMILVPGAIGGGLATRRGRLSEWRPRHRTGRDLLAFNAFTTTGSSPPRTQTLGYLSPW